MIIGCEEANRMGGGKGRKNEDALKAQALTAQTARDDAGRACPEAQLITIMSYDSGRR